MAQIRECDVCVVLKRDHTPKPVSYCSLCKVYLCAECKRRWDYRLAAFIKQKLGRY